jgi:hypothetical protein
MSNSHALLYKSALSVAGHLQALRVYGYENSGRARGAP